MFVRLRRSAWKIHTLYCLMKKDALINYFVFRSFFRTLAVNFVSDLCFYEFMTDSTRQTVDRDRLYCVLWTWLPGRYSGVGVHVAMDHHGGSIVMVHEVESEAVFLTIDSTSWLTTPFFHFVQWKSVKGYSVVFIIMLEIRKPFVDRNLDPRPSIAFDIS